MATVLSHENGRRYDAVGQEDYPQVHGLPERLGKEEVVEEGEVTVSSGCFSPFSWLGRFPTGAESPSFGGDVDPGQPKVGASLK